MPTKSGEGHSFLQGTSGESSSGPLPSPSTLPLPQVAASLSAVECMDVWVNLVFPILGVSMNDLDDEVKGMLIQIGPDIECLGSHVINMTLDSLEK